MQIVLYIQFTVMNKATPRRQYNTEWERKKRLKLKDSKPGTSATVPHTLASGDIDINTELTLEVPDQRDIDTEYDYSASKGNEQHVDSDINPLPEDCQKIWDDIDNHETLLSDFEPEEEPRQSLADRMREWVIKDNVKHNAADGMLKMWRSEGYNELPMTTRTLLKTCTDYDIKEISGTSYTYMGVKKQLTSQFLRYPTPDRENAKFIEISLNVDGLPLFKSTKKSVWPILGAIVNMDPKTVFPIAFTYGGSKPQNLDFLHDTIDELKDVLSNGIQIDTEMYLPVKLKCIVCDAPARTMVKSVKLVSGYYGCDKCEQKGTWDCKVTYPEVDALTLRTDERFREKVNAQHHHSDTPFTNLDIDMINSFPIDYMHQVLLGVMTRLILLWLRGPRTIKISKGQISEMNARMISLRKSIPNCFARKPRSFEEIDRWKATELRQFLLYTGKIVLKGIIPDDQYQHFLVLNVAINLLLGERKRETCYKYVHDLLKYCVFLYFCIFVLK